MLLSLGLLDSAQAGATQEPPRPLVVIDVPFIAQSVDLCGGAAAAMVLRYWGARDVQAGDFEALVDKDRGGITTGDLVSALSARGAVAHPIEAGPEDVRREMAAGRPIIAMIDGGGGQLHYVVIVAWASDRVLFHDPSVGPFRVRSEVEFLRLWRATGGFALVVTPGATSAGESPSAITRPGPPGIAPCDGLIGHATETARGEDPESAVAELLAARDLCPDDARPPNALAGIRFRQKRWAEAVAFARQASAMDAADQENWRLLGASLYLSDEPKPALTAWNRIDEPRLDRVVIEGLIRTRADLATAVIGLRPRDVLTTESIALAERRIEDLPSASWGRLIYKPSAGGRADVVASIGENRLIEPWRILAVRLGGELAAKREGNIRINSPTGRGEALEVGGRFAPRRPSVWVRLETPRLGGLPGVVSLGALWDRQTYRLDGVPRSEATVENRRRGSVDWTRWLTSRSRVEAGFGIDRFEGRGTFGSMRVGGEVRLAGDRAAVAADGGAWGGFGDASGFFESGASLSFRTSVQPRRLTILVRLDGRRASSRAPRALYPGAGKGPGRPFLLRSTRLVDQGEVIGEVFGRGLLHGTAEVETRLADLGPARVGLAVFSDWAKPWDTTRGKGPSDSVFALGTGLRIRASSVALRVDVAKRPGRSGLLVSAGVIPPWPR